MVQTPPTPLHPKADADIEARKRLFIGLMLGAGALVSLVLVLLWVVPYVGLSALHPAAPAAWGVVIGVLVATMGWAALGLTVNILTGRTPPFFRRLRGLTIKLFLPLMILVGRVFGVSKERVRNSFIKVNNEMVVHDARTYEPKQILLLMPHCLQKSECDRRLTYSVDTCVRCGKCPIKGLLDLRDKYGVHLAVATGGTIARRIVIEKRPKLIVAVACERDLAEGIQDTFPLPVFGVLNLRPFGPCLDTQLPFPLLEEGLRRFINPERLTEIDARPATASRPPKAEVEVSP